MSRTTLPLSSATASLINRPRANPCYPSFVAVSSFSATNCNFNVNKGRKGWMISCEVSLKSNNSTASVELDNNPSVSMSTSATASDDGSEGAKIGARVRVKVPLKVYHIPRVPEVDLTGMEGVLKQYVVDFKGKRISANLPYKVEFNTEIEGRGPVKFFAHLKEDEFDYLD